MRKELEIVLKQLESARAAGPLQALTLTNGKLDRSIHHLGGSITQFTDIVRFSIRMREVSDLESQQKASAETLRELLAKLETQSDPQTRTAQRSDGVPASNAGFLARDWCQETLSRVLVESLVLAVRLFVSAKPVSLERYFSHPASSADSLFDGECTT